MATDLRIAILTDNQLDMFQGTTLHCPECAPTEWRTMPQRLLERWEPTDDSRADGRAVAVLSCGHRVAVQAMGQAADGYHEFVYRTA